MSFLNPETGSRIFSSLGAETRLNKELKSFSIKARKWHVDYIKVKTEQSERMGFIRPIAVTAEEAEIQSAESSMKKSELIALIKSLLTSINESDRLKFHGLDSKNKKDLLAILQDICTLQTINEEVDNLELDKTSSVNQTPI